MPRRPPRPSPPRHSRRYPTSSYYRPARKALKRSADPYLPGRVDIIPVDEDRDYYERLTALAISSFDRDTLIGVGQLLHDWLKSRVFEQKVPDYYGPEAERISHYDYVLVDSRTGVTQLGGLCIGPLSDQLVVVTALNDQNVVGTRTFLEEVGVLARRLEAPNDKDAASEPAQPPHPKPTMIVARPGPPVRLTSRTSV